MVIIPLSFFFALSFFAFFKILIIVRLSFLRIPKEASELISQRTRQSYCFFFSFSLGPKAPLFFFLLSKSPQRSQTVHLKLVLPSCSRPPGFRFGPKDRFRQHPRSGVDVSG